jgi:hypothetical protein
MARYTTDLVFGVTGQTLGHRVQQGRATSATFKVFRDFVDDIGIVEFSGTATLDAINTTVSAASGTSQADPTKLNLTSTSGIVVGRKYLLSENSQLEWIEPIRVFPTYIACRYPIVNDYTTAGTFVGTNITAAVDPTWVADLSKISDHDDPNPGYRIRWDVIVNGVNVIHYSYCDLVRATVTHQVEIDDINARAPGLVDSLPVEYRSEQGKPLIDTAWRAVQMKLAALKLDTDAIRDNQAIDELVIMKALAILAMGGWKPLGMTSSDYIEATRTEYDRFIEQHFQVVLAHPIASGPSSAADDTAQVAISYWSK